MSASGFGGLWTYPSITYPDHNDFMFIDEDRRRIITFVVFSVDPLHRGSMRNWYQPESSNSISAKLRPNDEWRIHDFQLDGDRLSWTYGGRLHTWRRTPWEDRPDWLDSNLASTNSKMDAEECA
jgi:hypothetical protein